MKPSDLGRLLAYTLLGCVAFAGCWFLLGFLAVRTLGYRFSLTSNPRSWALMALGMGSMCWLSLVSSALLVLGRGPAPGRIGFRSLAVLAGWLTLVPVTLVTGVLWALGRFRGVNLPTRWMTPILLAIPVLWSLTWALDVTRRRRKAMEHEERAGP